MKEVKLLGKWGKFGKGIPGNVADKSDCETNKRYVPEYPPEPIGAKPLFTTPYTSSTAELANGVYQSTVHNQQEHIAINVRSWSPTVASVIPLPGQDFFTNTDEDPYVYPGTNSNYWYLIRYIDFRIRFSDVWSGLADNDPTKSGIVKSRFAGVYVTLAKSDVDAVQTLQAFSELTIGDVTSPFRNVRYDNPELINIAFPSGATHNARYGGVREYVGVEIISGRNETEKVTTVDLPQLETRPYVWYDQLEAGTKNEWYQSVLTAEQRRFKRIIRPRQWMTCLFSLPLGILYDAETPVQFNEKWQIGWGIQMEVLHSTSLAALIPYLNM